MPNILLARELHTATEVIQHPVISFDGDGMIVEITSDPAACRNETTVLTPAFFDIHTHGASGHDLMRASPDEIAHIQVFLAAHGVGHYLPTTVTAPIDTTLRALDALATAIELPPQPHQATPAGIHLEGPFLSHAKRGVHTPSELQPASIPLFERFQQAARGNIRLITIAPELPGALDLIAYCNRHDVRMSLGHTNATTAQALAGVKAGARSATHTFNAMRSFDHRDPGILGVALTRDDLYAELICDGVHVAPEAVQIFSRTKGLDRAILVTDSISATGMGDGTYKLGDLTVTVAGSRCLLAGTETLAGSVLTLEQAVLNYSRFTGLPWQKVVGLASRNPAQMLGLSPEIGNLAPGHAASFNRYDDTGKRTATYLRGQCIQ